MEKLYGIFDNADNGNLGNKLQRHYLSLLLYKGYLGVIAESSLIKQHYSLLEKNFGILIKILEYIYSFHRRIRK
jgi:hypothetical protein